MSAPIVRSGWRRAVRRSCPLRIRWTLQSLTATHQLSRSQSCGPVRSELARRAASVTLSSGRDLGLSRTSNQLLRTNLRRLPAALPSAWKWSSIQSGSSACSSGDGSMTVAGLPGACRRLRTSDGGDEDGAVVVVGPVVFQRQGRGDAAVEAPEGEVQLLGVELVRRRGLAAARVPGAGRRPYPAEAAGHQAGESAGRRPGARPLPRSQRLMPALGPRRPARPAAQVRAGHVAVARTVRIASGVSRPDGSRSLARSRAMCMSMVRVSNALPARCPRRASAVPRATRPACGGPPGS